ncbi:hypothetical protein FBEOM_3614 [Fusarium beomiforme]|uniref:Uncharacterized protein n=1 Tax=Fusarium beomiforme TaxID=44412 RepID=A0A9P5APD6_9HYPO|nr:hypothetical protein FBEOM_3614 [Fusarium beomiforme]
MSTTARSNDRDWCTRAYKAIQSLQDRLQSLDALDCPGVLWCTLLLGLFELMIEVTGGQWAKHMLYGTSRILQLSGAGGGGDYLGGQSFETFRLLEGNRAILYGDNTVLSSHSYHDITSTSPLDEILNSMAGISSFSKSFFDQIESIPEEQRQRHPDIDQLAASACILQYQLQSWYTQHSSSINSSGPYGKLALANYHALQLFLCRNFTYYNFWDMKVIPVLTLSELEHHVTGILGQCSAILEHSRIAALLTIFPLRMAGANAMNDEDRNETIRLLELVSQKGFVVSARIKFDLLDLWEYQFLNSRDSGVKA